MQSGRYQKTLNAVLLVLCILLQAGCAQSTSAQKQVQTTGKPLIGLSMDTLKEERWITDQVLFEQAAKKLGANVDVEIANDNGNTQNQQVQDLINRGIQVLVIIPHDANLAAKAVQMAQSAGVKVIAYDRLILNANVDLYVTFDNKQVGALMGQALVSKVPKGNYILLNGPKTDNNTSLLHQGLMSVLQPYIQRGDIKIVAEDWVNDWMADVAGNDVEKVLQKGETVNAVFSGNDGLAGGVIETLSEHRLAGKVMVVGQDADLAACQKVVEGQQLMTVYKPINQLAEKAAQFAYDMATGKSIAGLLQKDNHFTTIYDGKYNVPYYELTPIAVTKKNMMDTVIKDKFHALADVYRNVPPSEWPVANP